MANPKRSEDDQILSNRTLAEVILGGVENLTKDPLQFLVLGFIGFVLAIIIPYVASEAFWEAFGLGCVVAVGGAGLYAFLRGKAQQRLAKQAVNSKTAEVANLIQAKLEAAQAALEEKFDAVEGKWLEPENLAQTREILVEARLLFHLKGEKEGEVAVWFALGDVAGQEKDYAEAKGYFNQSLSLARELGNTLLQARVWEGLGGVAVQEKDAVEAKRHYSEAQALYEEMGDKERAEALRQLIQTLPKDKKSKKVTRPKNKPSKPNPTKK